jgi:uncharacterized protein YjiS (DUF1127 family)
MSSSTIESRASRTAGLTTGWQAALVNPIKRLIVRIECEWRVRRAIDELMALDDRVLADMGLTRGAVEHAARYGSLLTRETDDPPRRFRGDGRSHYR